MAEKRILEFENNRLIPLLFGEHNVHLSHLEKKLGISISDRGNLLNLSGEKLALNKAESVLQSMMRLLENKQHVGAADIDAALRFLDQPKPNKNGAAMSAEDTVVKTRKKTIMPRSPNQAAYIEAITQNEMVFGLGPAGTGKTYLAVAAGVSLFLEGKVEKMVFTRPALEAGERLGFLPGDMKEKVDPYLRPIYDALADMMPWDDIVRKMESGEIEIAPLAFMRGRTLAHSFVILDEAQNTTVSQMKMFLTRMGEGSRMVVTGDISQTDLPTGIKSGLRDATELLENVPEIKMIHFDKGDVTRHPLVGKIVHAYDQRK